MLKSYLKVAFRNLWKYRGFSAINIAGLAIGMAACLLILQYVSFKLSYDQFNKNANEIYRVVNDRYQQGKLIQHGTITYSGVGKAMNDDYEEVVKNTKLRPSGGIIIRYNDKKLTEDSVLFVENSFFSMFSYPLLAGDTRSVLKDPFSVVLSERLARKIFDYRGNDFTNSIAKPLLTKTIRCRIKIIGFAEMYPRIRICNSTCLLLTRRLSPVGKKLTITLRNRISGITCS